MSIKDLICPIKKDDCVKPWIDKVCRNPSHEPPNMLYIPPGQTHTHVCPGCGFTVVMHGSTVIW